MATSIIAEVAALGLRVKLLRAELKSIQTERSERVRNGVRAFAAYRDARRRLQTKRARTDLELSDFDVHYSPDESDALRSNRCLWVLRKHDAAERNLAGLFKRCA
jgi:hypothetical protein